MSPATATVADEKRRAAGPETARPALAFETRPAAAVVSNIMSFERSGATAAAGMARLPPLLLFPATAPPAPRTPSEVATLHAAYGNAAIARAAAGELSAAPEPVAPPSAAATPAPQAPAQAADASEIPAPAPAAAPTTLPATKPAAREVGAERPPPVPTAKQVTAPSAGAEKAATGAEAKADKAEAAVAPSPRAAIAPAVDAIRHRAATARKHRMPPRVLVKSAAEAGKKPHIEKKRADDCQTVEHVNVKAQEAETKGKGFKDAFKRRLEEAISANMRKTPSTESEADKLRERGAKNANAALQDESVGQSNAVIVPLKAAANPQQQPLGDSSAPPVQLEQVGPPPALVSAASVVPAPLPADRFDFSADHAPTDQVMAENNVTKEQLEEGNDPAFGPTLEARAEAEKHEAGVEARYRQAESSVQGHALGAAQHAIAHGLSSIHDARKTRIGDVTNEQYGTRDKNEAERKTITEGIDGIKNETLGDVNKALNLMEAMAVSKFQFGLERAEAAYDDAFKEARGGRARRAWNWLTKWRGSWTEHIENLLTTARNAYDAEVRRTIDDVADFVEQQLTNARLRVARGLQDVQIFVGRLDGNAQVFAKDAVTAVTADFNTMLNEIEHRSEGLIDKLSQQHKASYERMLETEEKLRQENKPLWERVYDATVGVIKKINELKDMLLDILGRAASAIWDIIKHPIRFLETLVSGVGDGLSNFIKKIDVYLQQGIFAWLLGESVQLPEKFDLAGVSSIVLQILHIDPAYFRARAVSLVGERVVTALEQGAEEFEIVRREGIPGLRRLALQHLSDLKSMVVDAIWGFIKNSVIGAGIEFILKLLTPASAFIAACKAIYEIVVFIIRRASQLKDLVSAVIDSIAAIAKGDASAAAGRVERALVKAIPVAIGFLASLLDLSDPVATVRSIIDKARSLVDRAIDAVINLAMKGVKAAGKLVAGVFGGKKEEKGKEEKGKEEKGKEEKGKEEKGKEEKGKEEQPVKHAPYDGQIGEVVHWTAEDESHELWIAESGGVLEVMMASADKEPVRAKLTKYEGQVAKIKGQHAKDRRQRATSAIAEARKLLTRTLEAAKATMAALVNPNAKPDQVKVKNEETESWEEVLWPQLQTIQIALHLIDIPETKIPKGGVKASKVTAEPLTKKGDAGTPPSGKLRGWDHVLIIDNEKLNPERDHWGPAYWVAGHLVSEKLHGPGDPWNTTPMRKIDNKDMEKKIESSAISKIEEDEVLYYEASVEYKSSEPILEDFPSNISIKWGTLRYKNKHWERGNALEPYSRPLAPPPLDPKFIPDVNDVRREGLMKRGVPVRFAMAMDDERRARGPFANAEAFADRMASFYGTRARSSDDKLQEGIGAVMSLIAARKLQFGK
jgi:hypothetical protein